MGVNNLWSILEPVRSKENLSALSNKTLCVDLSGWICEAQCAKGLKQHVNKPHLRNLFFRLLHLTRLGVKLVFVVDGKPPEVKWNAIAKRIQARQHGGGQFWKAKNPGKMGSAARVGRSHFAVWVRECRTLLNLLGVPCIESTGEAEALCAWLDLHQIVDGCITNDGDAFLYGARTVYKDLCISGKDASVECYKIEEIETKLNLNRQKLVALGILLGCDYLPQGVAGVGKEIAMRLIKNVNHDNLIDRFYEWAKSPTDLDENLSSVEKSVKCKALKDKNFPHPEVIQEFLTPKVVPRQVSLKIFNPDLQGLQEFCLKNLEWPEEYTREKVVLLITYWQMTSSLQHYTTTLVQPERIVKARIQQKIECYEVEWENVQLGETCPASFVTIETKQLFAQVYPELVEEFNDNEAVKLSKMSKKKKPAKLPATSDGYENEVELLSKQLEDLSVHHSSEQCHSSEAQHEKPLCFAGAISIDDSLQDIIDSILPSDSNDHSSHCLSLERSSPFTKMDGIKMKLSAADVGGNDNDDDNGYDNDDDWNDDKDNGYNDDDDDFDEEDDDGVGGGDDDDGIPWDFKPLHTQVVAANLDHESGSESNDDSQKLKTLKGVKATPDLQDVLECIDTDDYYHGSEDESSCNINKPIEHPTVLERKELEKFKPIPYSGKFKIVKPSENNNGHHGKNPKSMQSVKPSKAKAVLNDADLIEIFGSSDEEDDGKSSFMLKQTKLKDGTHDSRLCGFESRNNIPEDVFDTLDTEYPQGPMQHANKGTFSSNNDLKNAASEEHCSESINSSKGCCLSSVLQDVSCAMSIASSNNVGVKCVNGATAKKKVPPRGTRKVLKPANTSQHRTSQSSMQCVKGESHPTVQYDCVNGISPYGRSEKLEEHESWKENADSPFDDDMPAPLSKRLGKQFSAKQRLASLHSISSVSDDI